MGKSNFIKILFGVVSGSTFTAILVLSQLSLEQLKSLGASEAKRLAQASTPETSSESTTPTSPDTQASQNLLQVAASNNSFRTLSQVVQAAGLTETFSGQISYTLFAPTNDAFADLPKGTLQKLLQPQNQEILVKILSYHLVVGEITTNQAKSGQLPTVAGDSLTITVNNASHRIMVNKARVVKANIRASNGVIHAINKVLLPPGVKLSSLRNTF